MSWLVAATGSREMPSERASTFAEPPGTPATAGTGPVAPDPGAPGRPSKPLTTPLTVPSPPCTTTRSTPSWTAASAISPPWPRCRVCSTVSARRLCSAFASRSRPAWVVEVAVGLTISTARMTPKPTGAATMWAAARPEVGFPRLPGESDYRAQRDGYADAVGSQPPAPLSVRGAGAIVAVQGAIGLVLAAILLIRGLGGADQRVVNGFGP